ncbi:hypothetical protein Enr10x_26790 [Gimesia panareensis]|uniref:YokE-like PH domain-containing protein n=1 Tax=Gimesia panareensis TaxID=2527978 RepID=A0A517Q6V2_9PLAN|nr:hypothetical protein [Gimesia panareensis]QDT27362.1 hypothetical protein Enr10x_26790 [Gimesia panareensis]
MSNLSHAEVADKLKELKLELSPKISYRLETLFPRIEGWSAKGWIRVKFRAVKQLEPLLEEILLKGEQVLLVTSGNEWTLSRLFRKGGLKAASTSCRAIVMTNLRVLSFRTKDNGRPLNMIWSIYYSQLESLEVSLLGYTRLELRDGEKLHYPNINKEDQRWMQHLAAENRQIFRDHHFDPPVTQSCEQLCGQCFGAIPADHYECRHCGAVYWSPLEIGIRSFLFPSWGEILMKNYLMAYFEFNLFFLFFMMALLAAFKGMYFTGMSLFVLTCLLDAVLNMQAAAKGLYLKKASPISMKAESPPRSSAL